MGKPRMLFGTMIIMMLLLGSTVPLAATLAGTDDGAGEPEENALCEAGGLETGARQMEAIEPEAEVGGLGAVTPAHMALEDVAEICRAEPLEEATAISAGWQTIMSEDFESAFPTGLWTAYDDNGATNGEYYWDDDDYGPHLGSRSAWCARGGANGTDPQFYYYPNNMKSWMVYGPFDLGNATDAELSFYCRLDTESDHDYLRWMASVGGYYYGWIWSGNSGGWVSESFDLSDVPTLGNLCGQSQVWIAFNFESNGTIVGEGAFIDDIVLREYVGAVPFDLEAVEVYLSTMFGDTEKTSVVDTPTVGQDVYFYFKWSCLGSGTTPNFRVELKLDGTVFDYGRFKAEGGTNQTGWSEFPWTVTAGTHNVTGVLDVNDDIAEWNETNNEASKSWESASPELAVNGQVAFQGRPTPPHASWVNPLTVTVYLQGTSTVVGTYAVTTNSTGGFSFVFDHAPGTYDIGVKGSHTLSRVKEGVVIDSATTNVNFGTLLEGDCDNNDVVNINDFGILADAFGSVPASANWDVRADLNNDGAVNIYDFGLLADDFGLSGEMD
jgi:hypothetical protein